jgi:hypothetical protein
VLDASGGGRTHASVERVACVLTARVPQEVRVGCRVVRVAGVGGDGLLVRLLRGREVFARLPQERRVPPQRLRVRRLRAHRPLEEVLRPERPGPSATARARGAPYSITVFCNQSSRRRLTCRGRPAPGTGTAQSLPGAASCWAPRTRPARTSAPWPRAPASSGPCLASAPPPARRAAPGFPGP